VQSLPENLSREQPEIVGGPAFGETVGSGGASREAFQHSRLAWLLFQMCLKPVEPVAQTFQAQLGMASA
jgi:hypothetical protein